MSKTYQKMQLEIKQNSSLEGILKNVPDELLKKLTYIKLLFTNATPKLANIPLEKQSRVFNEPSSNTPRKLPVCWKTCENDKKYKLLKTIKLYHYSIHQSRRLIECQWKSEIKMKIWLSRCRMGWISKIVPQKMWMYSAWFVIRSLK